MSGTDAKASDNAQMMRLVDAIDKLPVPTVVLDQNENIIAFNRAADKLIALDADACLGQPITHYFAQDELLAFSGLSSAIDHDDGTELQLGFRGAGAENPQISVSAVVSRVRSEAPGEETVEVGYVLQCYRQQALQEALAESSRWAVREQEKALELRAARDRLQQMQEELEQTNRHLDQLVLDRTAELERALSAVEQASAAKSSFLSTMSHELRTPLNGVVGMATLLSSTRLDEEQTGCLEVIRASSTTLLAMINDLLDYSKLEAGQVKMESIEFDLVEILEESIHIVANQAHEKGVDVHCLIGPTVAAQVVGDPTRIRQIVLNLLNNAVKFTGRGHVLLEVIDGASHDRVAQEEGRCVITVRVRDTGIGISSSALSRLFQPFVQADVSTTRRFGGTGLGLSICKMLVDQMGGAIWAESTEGSGSIFSFAVPFELSQSHAIAPARLKTVHRVGLVGLEDRAGVCLQQQLVRLGYQPFLARKGGARTECRKNPAEVESIGSLLVPAERVVEGGSAWFELLEAYELQAQLLVILTRGNLVDLGSFVPEVWRPRVRYMQYPPIGRRLRRCLDRVEAVSDSSRGEVALPSTQRLRVLVVDDNAINQLVATKLLSRLDCEATCVGDGRQAVAICSERKFDLVLMDCHMPVMDGYQATKILRSEFSAELLPICALTADVMDENVARCRQAGMDSVLAKPIELTKLAELVESIRSNIDGESREALHRDAA